MTDGNKNQSPPADDDDLGDMYRAMREYSKERRARNREQSAKMLREKGVVFQERNGGAHLIVTAGDRTYDFWPGTGKWIQRGGASGRGVHSLLRKLEHAKTQDLG